MPSKEHEQRGLEEEEDDSEEEEWEAEAAFAAPVELGREQAGLPAPFELAYVWLS